MGMTFSPTRRTLFRRLSGILTLHEAVQLSREDSSSPYSCAGRPSANRFIGLMTGAPAHKKRDSIAEISNH